MGFKAQALSNDIHVDGDETIAARWVTRDEYTNLLVTGEIEAPGKATIARVMIEEWYGTNWTEHGTQDSRIRNRTHERYKERIWQRRTNRARVFDVPDFLQYSHDHVWVDESVTPAVLGITEFAANNGRHRVRRPARGGHARGGRRARAD